MKKFLVLLISLSFPGMVSHAQSLGDLSFGSDSTFEMITWNIEWFPKSGQTTADSVQLILESLDADVIALQEISDTALFKSVLGNIGGYESYFNSDYHAGLGYAYKTDSIDIIDLYSIYTTNPYWSPFPRAPMVMEMRFRGEKLVIINNHFKCCGNGILDPNDPGDEEMRRLLASQLLKQYIDSVFPNDNVILTGDLNDILTDIPSNNVFQGFIADTANYLFTDMAIAQGLSTGWSFPSWPSHLDHILITNELFDEFSMDSAIIEVLKIGEYMVGGFNTYDTYISDHRPVALKLFLDPLTTSMNEDRERLPKLRFYPNPAQSGTVVHIPEHLSAARLDLYSYDGQKLQSIGLEKGSQCRFINTDHLPEGIYFLLLVDGNRVLSSGRLLVTK